MINVNGELVQDENGLSANNRAFLLGDGVFETLKIVNGQILYFEDHYFRLMSGMRIVRMEIPMNFTMEFLEKQILDTAKANNCEKSCRVRFTVFRNAGGFYLPSTNTISYLITTVVTDKSYINDHKECEVDLYKDFYVTRQLLSTVKTTNRLLNITASIYADENGLQNCLLINDVKNVIEAINGNLFMRMGAKIVTPPLEEGCIKGILRMQVLTLLKGMDDYQIVEEPISPFDLQKADELFFTNVIWGVQSITKYRKRNYSFEVADQLASKLNDLMPKD